MTDDGDQAISKLFKSSAFSCFKTDTVRRLFQIVELRVLYLSRLYGWNFRKRTNSVEGFA